MQPSNVKTQHFITYTYPNSTNTSRVYTNTFQYFADPIKIIFTTIKHKYKILRQNNFTIKQPQFRTHLKIPQLT